MILGAFDTFGQTSKQLRKKENRLERLKMEQLMFRSPKTQKIPERIRGKELNYVYSSKAHLLPAFNPRARTTSTNFDIRGPFNVGGRTRAIGVDARNNSIMMIGGASGGLYRTTDGGTNWTLVSNVQANPSITDIAQDPTAQDTWYYTTGEAIGTVSTNVGGARYLGDGVYKSTDNGVTWNQLSSTDPVNEVSFGSGTRGEWQYCHDIAVDPIDGAVLVANIKGIYRSADGGTTWTQVLDAATSFSNDITHFDVVKTGATTRVYYAGVHSSGTNSGFFKSSDGVNWTKIISPSSMPTTWERIEVAIAPSNPDVAWFFLSASGGNYRLYKYRDSPASWFDRSSTLPALGGNVGNLNTQGSYNMVMSIKPDNEDYIFIAGTSLYRSTDGFATGLNASNTGNTQWIGGYSPDNDVNRYPSHHPDVHSFMFLPGSNTTVLCGHDGGLSKTTDITTDNGIPAGFSKRHPVTWTALNNGYYTTQAYSIAIDPTTGGDKRILLGFQDNGNWSVNNTSATALWSEEIAGGDGCYGAIVAGEDTRYHSTQNGSVLRVTGANAQSPTSFHHVHPAAATGQLFVNPFILDKNDQKMMYYPSGTKLWRHNDVASITPGFDFDGTNDPGWTELTSAQIIGGKISAIDVSKTTANVVYYGTTTGKVYKLDNANTGTAPTRTDITGASFPSGGFVSCVSVDREDANKVFVTFSNYEVISIFYSSDGGTNWTDVSGNLEENADGSGNGPSIRWITTHNLQSDGQVYYVGASTGLYSTSNLNGTSTVWTQESTDVIGNVPVSMIKTRKEDGLVAVGTHGKGSFSANVVGFRPSISSFNPANGTTAVDTMANLSVIFNEDVVAGSGNITIKKNLDDSVVETIAATAGIVSISGGTVTIDPTNDLPAGTQLYIEIDKGAFKNASGGQFIGISDKTTWAFTTVTNGNVSEPTISSFSPANGATGVDITANVSFTFSESVVVGTGNITIKKASDDSVIETIAATAGTVSISGGTVTIDPTNDLPTNTQLYIEMDAGVFKSISGGAFAGITGKTTWSFTTAGSSVTSIAGVFDQALKVFPNPATEQVSVRLEKLSVALAKAELYNSNGKLVSEKLLKPVSSNDLEGGIDLSKLPKGSYVLKVITPQHIISRVLVVQ